MELRPLSMEEGAHRSDAWRVVRIYGAAAGGESAMTLLTLIEAAERLRRKPRRLREFLREHPLGLDGRPLYLQDGRDKLFSLADVDRI